MKLKSLSINNREELLKVSKALANDIRLSIILLLSETSYTVNEIAIRLNIPISTAAVNIKILEDAEIIIADYSPGKHGSKKLCSRKYDNFNIELENKLLSNQFEETFVNIPIGSFNDCDVLPTCGMASEHNFLVAEDIPEFFFTSNRYKAQILWFTGGYVNYKFFNPITKHMKVNCIEISFEACSEAPNYRNDYKSDITLYFNNIPLGTWTCKGDYGGRRGTLNPKWWSSSVTQYGELKTWKITKDGTFLDDIEISPITLMDVDSYKLIFELRVAIAENAKNKGGINLFGKLFGDYNQDIVVKIQYDK